MEVGMAPVVGTEGDVSVGGVVPFQIEGETIAIANVGGTLYAFDDRCSHRGCSLSEGMLDGTSITCPCHFSVFQVTDGAVLEGPATKAQQTYEVSVEDGKIILSIGDETPDEGNGSLSSVPTSGSTTQPSDLVSASQSGAPVPDHERIHNALASVPLFSDLDEESIERLEAFAFRKSFSAGEVIVEEGHTGNGLYIVLSGTVDVVKDLGGDHQHRVAVLQAGEPFGEMALLGDWKRSASVQATNDVECLGMDRWAFLAHLKNEPNLAIRMLQMLANRLVETNKRLIE
jgi:3-phenylpropionate/trans-cinnamate dioxygenase ferredoxin subunit